jgi:hypothetical protein
MQAATFVRDTAEGRPAQQLIVDDHTTEDRAERTERLLMMLKALAGEQL